MSHVPKSELALSVHPPPTCTPYDYDDPGPPFTPDEIAAIDSIKAFLSESELAQARRLETVYYNPVFKSAGGTPIPGLRQHAALSHLYVCRYNDQFYGVLLEGFLAKVYEGCSEAELGGVNWPWFRVTTPDGNRHYPLHFNGNLQAWTDRMMEAAAGVGTTMGWFDHGKFRLTDGRTLSFGDLQIDRLAGGKPIPDDW